MPLTGRLAVSSHLVLPQPFGADAMLRYPGDPMNAAGDLFLNLFVDAWATVRHLG